MRDLNRIMGNLNQKQQNQVKEKKYRDVALNTVVVCTHRCEKTKLNDNKYKWICKCIKLQKASVSALNMVIRNYWQDFNSQHISFWVGDRNVFTSCDLFTSDVLFFFSFKRNFACTNPSGKCCFCLRHIASGISVCGKKSFPVFKKKWKKQKKTCTNETRGSATTVSKGVMRELALPSQCFAYDVSKEVEILVRAERSNPINPSHRFSTLWLSDAWSAGIYYLGWSTTLSLLSLCAK